MGEITGVFEEKLASLLDVARKKKNVLEKREIQEHFKPEVLDGERWEKIYELLDGHQIDVLQVSEDAGHRPRPFFGGRTGG